VVRPECIASGQEELLKFTGFKSIGQKRKEIRRIVMVQQGSSHTEQKNGRMRFGHLVLLAAVFCKYWRACRPNHGCSASGSDFFPIRDVAVVMRTWQPWIWPFEQISRWSRSYVLHLMILRMTYYLMMLLWLGTMVRTREALRTSLEAYRDKPDATPSWRPSSNKLGTCSYLRDEPCVFTAL